MNESITAAVQRALPRAASKAFLAATHYVTHATCSSFSFQEQSQGGMGRMEAESVHW